MIAVISNTFPPLGASVFVPSAQTLFLSLNLAWAACEIWLSVRRRARDNGGRDAGTLGLLWRVLGLAIAAAVCITVSGYGHLPAEWRVPARWVGCVLLAAGLVLRVWSIRVLARFFTVDVKVHADHELIERGPYRWVRHPSYAGALLAFLGLGGGAGQCAGAAGVGDSRGVDVLAAYRGGGGCFAGGVSGGLSGLCGAYWEAVAAVLVTFL